MPIGKTPEPVCFFMSEHPAKSRSSSDTGPKKVACNLAPKPKPGCLIEPISGVAGYFQKTTLKHHAAQRLTTVPPAKPCFLLSDMAGFDSVIPLDFTNVKSSGNVRVERHQAALPGDQSKSFWMCLLTQSIPQQHVVGILRLKDEAIREPMQRRSPYKVPDIQATQRVNRPGFRGGCFV